MLKRIATARSEWTVKHKKKASYKTDYIVPDLIDFFLAMIEKRSKRKLIKGIFIFVKNCCTN